MHWAVQYLNKPWTIDGYGPDSFNCWGLLHWIYAKHLATELPRYANISPHDHSAKVTAFEAAAASKDWVPIKTPVDLCAVGLSHHRKIHHVGIFLDVDGGLVLHAMEGKGVLCQSRPTLRANGWNRISFYQYRYHVPPCHSH